MEDGKGGQYGVPDGNLVAYLESISAQKKPLPRRKVQKKPRRLKTLTGGDPARGEKLVARYCTHCHNAGDTAFSFELRKGRKRAALVADSVRGYDEKGRFKPDKGMSYFTQDRLTDEQLKHIVAFVGK